MGWNLDTLLIYISLVLTKVEHIFYIYWPFPFHLLRSWLGWFLILFFILLYSLDVSLLSYLYLAKILLSCKLSLHLINYILFWTKTKIFFLSVNQLTTNCHFLLVKGSIRPFWSVISIILWTARALKILGARNMDQWLRICTLLEENPSIHIRYLTTVTQLAEEQKPLVSIETCPYTGKHICGF